MCKFWQGGRSPSCWKCLICSDRFGGEAGEAGEWRTSEKKSRLSKSHADISQVQIGLRRRARYVKSDTQYRLRVVNVGSAWKRAHLKPITPPSHHRHHHPHQLQNTHTHTQTQQHHITIVNRITGSVTRLCLLTKCILASQSCTWVFSWALTHKHVQDWANKELIDSLQLRQTSQGVIRSGMYIVAVHQVFLEFAVCTKSRLTVLLLPGILHPQPTSLSSPGPQS